MTEMINILARGFDYFRMLDRTYSMHLIIYLIFLNSTAG